jgi:non-reducing end alpha-L-arabinofuranosidase
LNNTLPNTNHFIFIENESSVVVDGFIKGTQMHQIKSINSIALIVFSIAIGQKSSVAAEGPCDIYATGTTPCVAAYSMIRSLSSKYTGPLYQVRKADGTTKDIAAMAGYANSADQDAFCGTGKCTVSILYDQSGKANDITKAPAGCYTGTASQPDNESDAKARSVTVGGHKVYALYMIPQDGYRNNKATGMPTGSAAQGIYEMADGKRVGTACCWDFGNASVNNCNGGTGLMNSIYFGTGYWGTGAGKGPWFLGDFENGVWSGGSGASKTLNSSNPSMAVDYAFGILKTNSGNYAIRVGNGQSGSLTTAYDGKSPANWAMKGGIVLGIGGDNSNSSLGTFFEGAITAGRPSDEVDALVLKNVQAAGYGGNLVATQNGTFPHSLQANSITSNKVIRFTLLESRRGTLNIFDYQGKWITNLLDGIISEGTHEVVWEVKQIPTGIYVATLTSGGRTEWTKKIRVGK